MPNDIKITELEIGGTPDFIHPEAEERLANALSGTENIVFEDRVRWDLYALGRTLISVLNGGSPDLYRDLGPYRQRYLQLLSCRLLDGRNLSTETAIGLAPEEFRSLRYVSAEEPLRDLKKLQGEYDLTRVVPELDPSNPDRLQTSAIGATVLTPRLRRLVGCSEVARLGTFHQLGLLNLVYPTATHTRLEHALGTYTVACEYIRWLLGDEQNPFFLQVVTAEDVRAVLLAALLHDIGHYPLAHDFEEADGELFDHEARTKSLLLRESSPLHQAIGEPEPEGWAVAPQRICDILSANPTEFKYTLIDRVLHSVVSGPLDADKIDYLTRDSTHLGTSYGSGIDVSRLLRTLTILLEPAAQHTIGGIGTQEKGKIPAETMAFARYAMFGAVYWHHAYRSIKAMIHWIVWDYLRSRYISAKGHHARTRRSVREELYNSLDSHMDALFDQDSSGIVDVGAGSYLPAAESRQLEWCVRRGGTHARDMFRLLSHRSLFKRMVVLSPGRDPNLSDHDWRELSKLFSAEGGADAWMRRVVLARSLQDLIRQRVSDMLENEFGTVIFNEEKGRREFLDLCSRTQIVLVDFPDPGRARQDGLKFTVEEYRVKSRVDTSAHLETRESEFFERLGEGFTRGIGKVRILVHPRAEEFLKNFLTRETIAMEFSKALRQSHAANVSEHPYFALSAGLPSGKVGKS
jgi:HD superfamily phosphohydrolase